MAEMADFYVTGNLKWGRRKWPVIYNLEYMACSVEKTLLVAWLDEKLLLL